MCRSLVPSAVLAILVVVLSGCGSGGSSVALPDTLSCPQWSAGDTMTFFRTETVGTAAATSTATVVVTERTTTSAVLSDGTTTWTYAVSGGKYIPLKEAYVLSVDYSGTVFDYNVADTYSSSTAFCPPPGVGASYGFSTWIPGPFEGTGDYVPATMTVTGKAVEQLTVPAGAFRATKLVLAKTGGRGDSTVTRYYASGVGLVKEIEVMSSVGTTTTVTRELTSYNYQ